MSLFDELKRRNVFRVAIAYLVAAWLLLQLTDVLSELLALPEVAGRFVVLVLVIGFPVAIIFAWAFELTPEGVKREHEVDRSQSVAPQTGRKLNNVILVMLALSVVYLLYDKFSDTGSDTVALSTEAPIISAEVNLPATEQAKIRPSIAVLPFVNMSDDPAQVYFSDGISEELLNVLAAVDGLSVASRTSSFAFKDQTVNLIEIAEKLKVSYVLEGSVRKAGERVRITAQLIETANDRHLWSESYDRSLADIFAVQSEIANEIASALSESLDLEIQPLTVTPKTANLNAYDLFLKGRSAWLYRKKGQDLIDAVDYLQRALDLDPDFLDAKEVLAVTWLTLPYWTEQEESLDVFEARAVALAQEVLAEDPNRVLALISLAQALPDEPELGWVPYKELYERALLLEPENTTAIHWLGLMYQDLGYPERAIPLHEKCIELDPDYSNCHDQLIRSLAIAGESRKADLMFGEHTIQADLPLTFADLAYALEFEYFSMAAVMFRHLPRFESAPTASLFKILENPNMDRQPMVEAWQQWAKENDYDLIDEPIIMAILGEFDSIDLSTWSGGDLFTPIMAPYRRSPEFKKYARDEGLFATWKHLGFPRWCRAVGEDDFECE